MSESRSHAAVLRGAAALLRQRGYARRRLLAAAGVALAAAVAGALTVWAFLAYTHPDRVLDFAAFLQMCGIPLAR